MKKTLSAVAVVIAVATSWSTGAPAHDDKSGDITITGPWARATAPMAKTGAAFVTVKNGGSKADRLVGAASSVSKKVALHESLMEGDIMMMRHVISIDVPAGGMAVLKPGGYHVMLMGLKGPLKEGTTFPLTLVFENAGRIEVTVKVMKAGAMGGMKMKHAN